jgi:hypothetical protein
MNDGATAGRYESRLIRLMGENRMSESDRRQT